MARRADIAKFLRVAVKTGLRMQHRQVGTTAEPGDHGETGSEGVATLQRIKASLSKRKGANRIEP